MLDKPKWYKKVFDFVKYQIKIDLAKYFNFNKTFIKKKKINE